MKWECGTVVVAGFFSQNLTSIPRSWSFKNILRHVVTFVMSTQNTTASSTLLSSTGVLLNSSIEIVPRPLISMKWRSTCCTALILCCFVISKGLSQSVRSFLARADYWSPLGLSTDLLASSLPTLEALLVLRQSGPI